NHIVASVPLVLTFANELTATECECQNRDTARKPLRFLGKPACTARNLWQQWIGYGTAMLQPCNAKSGERLQMSVRHSLFAAAIASSAALALSPASGQTLRYANQGELKS